MGKSKGKTNSSKGSSDPQLISGGIEKRPNRHQTSHISEAPIFTQGHAFAPPYPNEPPFLLAIPQPRAFAPPYPNGPPFLPAIPQPHAFAPSYPGAAPFPPVPLHASSSSALLQEEDMSRGDELGGYIFMCNGSTKADCYMYRVLGLPASRIAVVEKIKPRMKLFLYDFDVKLLYGIYVAASNGVMALEPTAFRGKFPAQVRFEIFKDCLPLPESAFKHIVTYQEGSKFKQELSGKQVADLISLFRPIASVSLERTAVAPRRIEPPNGEAWSRPAVELSASYDRYLAGLYTEQRGHERYYGHVEQISTPMHLQQVVPQPKPELYYTGAAQQAYHPDIPSLAPLELYSRYAALRRDDGALRVIREPRHPIAGSQGSNPLPAAYLAALGSRDPDREHSGHHYQLQESAGSRVENVLNSLTGAGLGHNAHGVIPQTNTVISREYYRPNVAVPGNYAPVQTHEQTAYHPTVPPHEATHLPSSSQTAAYWTGVAYHQGSNGQAAPSGDVGVGGEAGAVPVVMHN